MVRECMTCEKAEICASELHYTSKEHAKEALITLRCFCVACSIELHTPSAVKLHLQNKRHLNKVRTGCHLAWDAQEGWFCETCALHFSKELGFELHLASYGHGNAFGGSHGLKDYFHLEAVVEQLSPVPCKPWDRDFQLLCSLCQESCERLDDFLEHLLSNGHLQHLRQTVCLVCHRYMCITELASHLHSSGHAGQVDCCQTEVFDTRAFQEWWKCSCCFIACRSWHGFAAHLRDGVHVDNMANWWIRYGFNCDSDATSRSRVVRPSQLTSACSLAVARKWDHWREHPTSHSGWCHVCGIVLRKPNLVEAHLANHVPSKAHRILDARDSVYPRTNSPADKGCGVEKPAEIFECSCCSVSFSNEFDLTVHNALQQHLLRRMSPLLFHEWCRACGVTVGQHHFQVEDNDPELHQPAGVALQKTKRSAPEAVETMQSPAGPVDGWTDTPATCTGISEVQPFKFAKTAQSPESGLQGSPAQELEDDNSCGNSFCTRHGCRVVQPLLIEIPPSPVEEQDLSISIVTAPSPNSTAQDLLSALSTRKLALQPTKCDTLTIST